LAYPLLDEFLVKEMAKLGKTPKDILTNAVPKLVAMRKEQEKELLEDKTRMEKFCTSAVKREAESRKKNNELQSEVRTKERQLRDREEGLKIQEADFKALQWKNQKTLQKESKVSDAQLRIEQDKVADLEKRLHTSNEALRTLQLDYDSVSTDLQELKLSDSVNKAKISSESDQQASIDKLKEDLERYRGLYQATRSNEEIVQGRIDKAVREKNKELSVLREELEASQKQSADKSMDYEAKLLADLATRDETIQDLSRANIGLRDTTSTQDAEIMRLKESRAAAVKLLLY
jgi:DNA repair exonuclease SbcCD ATPase subunit